MILGEWKGRYVFRGNQVKDEFNNNAIFDELSSSPATLEASKAVDAYGLLDGHNSSQCDAEQAYVQSRLGGIPTWVRLPRDRWPAEWKNYRRPVVQLKLALYGHPDAGGYWEQHCEGHVTSKGFQKIQCWRSCYFHPTLRLLLIIYVDDFKLSGPTGNLKEGWRLIQEPSPEVPKGIEIDPPTKVGRYLGCEHRVSEKWIDWQGENPTVLDPPPPKQPKNVPDAAPSELAHLSIPDGSAVWIRRDPQATNFKTLLPESGGPEWSTVTGRITLDEVSNDVRVTR